MHERVSDRNQNRPPQPALNSATAVLARRKRPIATAGRVRTDERTFRFDRRSPREIDRLKGRTSREGPSAPGLLWHGFCNENRLASSRPDVLGRSCSWLCNLWAATFTLPEASGRPHGRYQFTLA
jgi:hypothetical protein